MRGKLEYIRDKAIKVKNLAKGKKWEKLKMKL